MAIIGNLGRVLAKKQSAWGSAASPDSTNQISCEVFLPTLVQEALMSETFRGGWHAHQVHPGSKEGAEFTIAHVIQGVSPTTPTNNPTAHPDVMFLESVLGSVRTAVGYLTLASSGQGVGALTVPDGSLTSDFQGVPVLVPVAASPSGRQIAWCKTRDASGDPDIITPWFPLLGAATNGGQSYGSITVELSTTQPTPITVLVELKDGAGNARVEFVDVVCTGATLDIAAGQLARIAYTLKAGSWTIVPGSDLALYTNTYPELPPAMGVNGAMVPGSASKTIPTVQLQVTATVTSSRSIGADDAFAQWWVTDRDAALTVTELVDDYSVLSPPGTLVAAGIQVDLCTTPGRACSVLMANPQHSALAVDEDASGIVVRKATYKPRPATGAADLAIAFM